MEGKGGYRCTSPKLLKQTTQSQSVDFESGKGPSRDDDLEKVATAVM